MTLVGFAAGFTLVWDSDIFWHLASGEWMLDHGKVLGTDPYSIDPQPVWVNVHWLFQLIIAGLYRLGGFAALSTLTGILAAATLGTFALALRKCVPPAWLMLCGLGMLITIVGRIRVRPEAFTLLFLVVTIVLTDSVRRGAPGKRLWWLVPMMLAWVNMHGIYILGQAVLWSAIAGAAVEKWVFRNRDLQGHLVTQAALLPALACLIVCFLTPWPVEAAIQPILLWTRVSGAGVFYTYGVSELYPTWRVLPQFVGPLVMVIVTAMVLMVNFILGLVARKPRVPLSHVLWLIAFTFLAALAKRNIALVGPVCAFLLAWHGKDILASVRSGKLMTWRYWPATTVLLLAVTLAQGAAYATEYTYRKEHAPFHFGAGLMREEFAIDLAKWLAGLKAKGDIVTDDFGDASAFLYYASLGRSEPARLLYMDGRLEAHDEGRFVDQHKLHEAFQEPSTAAEAKLPPSARFVIVRQNASSALSALTQCPRFRLVRIDRTAACFEDTRWAIRNGPDPLPADCLNLAQYDQPVRSDGFVDETPVRPRTWWRQNPISLNYRTGEMLLWLGEYDSSEPRGFAPPTRYVCTLLSARYLEAAAREDSFLPVITAGMLAQAYQQRAYQNYYAPSAQVPINMDLARTLRIYRQLNLTDLADSNLLRFAEQRLRALVLAGQTDAASGAMSQFLASLPAADRVSPKRDYLRLRDLIQTQLTQALDRAKPLEALNPIDQATALTDPRIWLIEQAVALVKAPGANLDADTQFRAKMLLGDLLLRKGMTEQARSAYLTIPDGTRDVERSLRLALCEWAEGNLVQASKMLRETAATATSMPASVPSTTASAPAGEKAASIVPLINFYQADLAELMGDYPAARKALDGIKADNLELAGLIDRLRLRLEARP